MKGCTPALLDLHNGSIGSYPGDGKLLELLHQFMYSRGRDHNGSKVTQAPSGEIGQSSQKKESSIGRIICVTAERRCEIQPEKRTSAPLLPSLALSAGRKLLSISPNMPDTFARRMTHRDSPSCKGREYSRCRVYRRHQCHRSCAPGDPPRSRPASLLLCACASRHLE